MNIEYINIGELIPYEHNRKVHDEKQIKNVAESIKRFGFVQPVVIDENNVIVIGHCRTLAAERLEMGTVPCVRVNDLTEDEIRLLRIADNKTNESAWDFGELKIELSDLDLTGFNFDFDVPEFDAVSDVADENDVDEKTVPSRVKRGEVWELGTHRLLCGDCLNDGDMKRLMNGFVRNMRFIDPPYGYEYQSHHRGEWFNVLENDDSFIDFFPVVKKYNDGFVFVCTAWKVVEQWVPLFKNYFDMTNMIIWDKSGGGMGDLKKTFATDFEIIMTANNGHEIVGERIGSVWTVTRNNPQIYVHPTQKPVELMKIAIEHTTYEHDIVLDLFGGSGSTMMAREQTKRRCFMAEIDEHYCDVIIQRWENLTGRTAVKVDG